MDSRHNCRTRLFHQALHVLHFTLHALAQHRYNRLCRACRCLFWKALGHPCSVNLERLTADERDRYCVPIPPLTFLTFFSL